MSNELFLVKIWYDDKYHYVTLQETKLLREFRKIDETIVRVVMKIYKDIYSKNVVVVDFKLLEKSDFDDISDELNEGLRHFIYYDLITFNSYDDRGWKIANYQEPNYSIKNLVVRGMKLNLIHPIYHQNHFFPII